MSLFGSMPQNSLSQNLFGSTPSGGSLFGGNNTGQQQPLFGSLPSFGPQPSQGNSLFGSQSQNNNSLFGQPSNQSQNSSLFGGTSTPLFGGSNNLQFQNQSFLGNSQQNNGSSLFGGMNTNTGNNNLFNGNGNQGGFNNFNNKGSNGFMFNPVRISDPKETINMMSITVVDQFKSLSFEELKVQDLPSRKLGQFQPASNMGLFGGSTNTNNNLIQQNNNINMNQGSSLFGGNQSTSLFGNTNNQQTGGGLFGNQNNNTNGSLFGGNTQTNTGGLFGNANNTNNNNTGGGLFGNQQQNNQTSLFGNTNTSGGLFGSSTNQQNNTVGLFGNTTNSNGGLFGNSQQNNKGGLFSNSNSTQGGLFGNNNNNQQSTGGLFGNTNNNNQQNSGGLFGNVSNQSNSNSLFKPSTTGGLFGSTNTQPSSGGLFGNTNTQPTNTGGGLFGNNSTSLFGGNNNNNQQKSSSLFGGTTQTSSGSLFGNTSNSTSLFGNQQSSLFSNPNNQPKLNLFGQPTQQNQSSSSLFSTPQQNQSTSLFGSTPTPLFTNMYSSQIPVMPVFQPIPLQVQNEALNQYIFGLQKTKTLTQIISELQNDYNSTKKRKDFEEYNEHINYDNYMTDRLSEFKDFLKFKRNNNKIRVKKSTQQPINTNTEKDVIVFKESNNDNNQALFEPIRSDFFKKQRRDIKLKPKAHSCDMTKLAETKIISNLETSFDRHINFKDFPSCKVPDSPFLELFIQITEPYRATFSLKVNREAKFSLLKSTIADTLKQKNIKYNDITSTSFFLMKKYAIVKETNTVKESDLEDKDTLFIILKESISKSEVSYTSFKDSIVASAKKKTKKKSELAPVEKLPILTNTEYKINPDLKAISRMTLEELEQIDNFSISNKNGKIEFEETIDLTGVNLDQIVNILPGRVELYKNNNISFLPQPGKGLNKKAVIHLYNISDNDDVESELSLQYLQEKTKEINGEFKSFNRDSREYIYKVDHF